MSKAQSVRCQAKYHLNHNPSGGSLLMMFERNAIYVKCGHGNCGRWTKLSVEQPGVELNFNKAAFKQQTMPKNFSIGRSQPPIPPPRIPVVLIGD